MKANVSTGPIALHIVARLTTLFTALVLTAAFILNCTPAQTLAEIVPPSTAPTSIEASNPVDSVQFPNKTYLPILINRQRSPAVWELEK